MAAQRMVRIVLRGEVAGLQAQLKSTAGLVRNVADEMTGTSKEADRFRQGLSAAGDSAMKMGLVAAAGVGLITKAAIDWESAWTGVLKTVDGTPAQLSAIEQGLRDMTGELPATHQELAAIAEAAGALGVQTDSILEFTRVAADLGESTNLSATDAAEGLAQLMNVLRTSPDDVDRLGSVLVALGNNGASTESQILEMAQGIAGAGSIVGASESDILALSNALASVGIEAEAGGSSVSAILQDMATAAKNGGADLELFASTAGLSAEQFAAAFEKRPVEAFNLFTQGLGRVNEEGGNVFAILKQLGQSDIRVSRALLTMAQSGDLLTDSLATGASEWERNTALAGEAAKRYDTTAAQVSIAWNNIKDSAIDAGQGMLPVVESVASGIGALSDAFGALPEGATGSIGLVGAVGAAGLIAVGGVSKLVTTVTNAREALDQLGEVAPRSADALGKAGAVAGKAAGAFVAWQALAAVSHSPDVEGVSTYTAALLGLSTGADGARSKLDELFTDTAGGLPDWVPILSAWSELGTGVEGVAEAFDKLDASNFGRAVDHITPWADGYDRAKASVTQLDAALTSLVQSGAVDDAADGFDRLMSETGRTKSELLDLLPQYKDAIAGLSNEQKIAASTATDAAKAQQSAAEKVGMTAEEYDKARTAALGQADAFLGLGDSLNDAKVDLNGWLTELEKQNEALAEFTSNAIIASTRGVDVGLIDQLREAGPEGALRLSELADATEREIGRANEAFRTGEEAASRYADVFVDIPSEAVTEFKTPGADDAVETAIRVARQYELTPDQVETIMRALDYSTKDIRRVKEALGTIPPGKNTTITASTGQAQAAIASLRASLQNLAGTNWVASIVARATTARANGGAILRAEGGSVVGPGTGTSDSIPAVGPGGAAYRLSNGEHVLTAREVDLIGGQNAVYAMRAAIRSQQFAFASGGAVGSGSGGVTAPSPSAPQLVRIKSGALEIRGGQAYITGLAEVVVSERERFNDSNRRAGR